MGHALGRKLHDLNGHLSSLDFGKIKDIVDDIEETARRLTNTFNIAALFSVQFSPKGQVGHADNGIHWRAYFMAHIRQEIRLHLRCFECLFSGLLKLFEQFVTRFFVEYVTKLRQPFRIRQSRWKRIPKGMDPQAGLLIKYQFLALRGAQIRCDLHR